ncbi:MAG: SH3 domain-containing protein [Bdellovibrionales bacterium]|nr:SH3 domain-containing protein [Bdellovibrionales bacterium]
MKKLLGLTVLLTAGFLATGFAETVTPKGKSLNFRKSPSTKAAHAGEPIPQGEKLMVIEKNKKWLKVKKEDGSEGWVYAKLVKSVSEGSEMTPSSEAPAADSSTEMDSTESMDSGMDNEDVNPSEDY